MDNYEDENKALLERFATALKEGDVTADFDVEELLDIFDVAGDYGMDYLRAEALFWGAALCSTPTFWVRPPSTASTPTTRQIPRCCRASSMPAPISLTARMP